ncbi:hypothetical protein [Dermatophilus congolensis]|nr:hypothetical protein [Dermatophilus congolensis]MBO3142193.1 hypothetical protein [Dermatophilus congolensis]MBO3151185.1 hypothetical protein [Dermatophilus congolensis]MBO3161814.1 hypothetical protein [Dermatophilus congolensis]MBO3162468.1 hypothetical protein [Dermatophilus congolensis]MBO3176024.1 hypothetical protein [Dermatophilus congolensis]
MSQKLPQQSAHPALAQEFSLDVNNEDLPEPLNTVYRSLARTAIPPEGASMRPSASQAAWMCLIANAIIIIVTVSRGTHFVWLTWFIFGMVMLIGITGTILGLRAKNIPLTALNTALTLTGIPLIVTLAYLLHGI